MVLLAFYCSHRLPQDGIRVIAGLCLSDPSEKVWGLGPVDGFCSRGAGSLCGSHGCGESGNRFHIYRQRTAILPGPGRQGYTFSELPPSPSCAENVL